MLYEKLDCDDSVWDSTRTHEELGSGMKAIRKAAMEDMMSSQDIIDAQAMWRTIVFLKRQLEQDCLSIQEVEADNVLSWII